MPARYAGEAGAAAAKLYMRVTGLENFGLTEASFRHLGTCKVSATVYLRTYEVTFEVRRLPPSRRHSYLTARVNRWIKCLRLNYPSITFRVRRGEPAAPRANKWWSLPKAVEVCCSAREILNLAAETNLSCAGAVCEKAKNPRQQNVSGAR